jgi:hypothetical protein
MNNKIFHKNRNKELEIEISTLFLSKAVVPSHFLSFYNQKSKMPKGLEQQIVAHGFPPGDRTRTHYVYIFVLQQNASS